MPQAAPCLSGAPQASAADVVVVHGRRTAICRAGRGGFKDTTPDELLSAVMTAVLKDVNLRPEQLGDICVGGIRNGSYDIGMACGVESMSLADRGNPGNITSRLMEKEKARDCLIPMGITSENVAERFGISREKQDTFALASQQNLPLGNSSQVSDGAAAILLARRSKAEELGLPILGVLRSYAVVGVPPDIMGIGPAYAIPVALQKAGLTVSDVDIFEINEAFASQAAYCVEKLRLPPEKVNPLGGAVALGHPLGCTGARQVITLLNELKRRGKRAYGVVSMCIGTGMGAAAVFEYPGN
ncbi:ACAA1 isoform 12 [Pan troglodytes]|uniref:ACAA1 isoform 12 n=1 Tax=Pan troglodytes TaxID=9598 RepID=A0A2J8NQB0_PANTR|nr:ACAA1 isoform 12 [Pan troglodytes]